MKKLKACILVILLTMLLTDCCSVKTVYKEKTIVPEVTFPIFPTAEKMTNNHNGTVTVPAEWIILLEEYHIKIEETQNNYQQLKELYSDGA